MSLRKFILLMGVIAAPVLCHATSKGMFFFYRLGTRVDRYLLLNVDTNYITLPGHSWRFALTGATVGLNSEYRTREYRGKNHISMHSQSTPSVDIGFNAGYRGFGFGYSWDIMNAYAHKFNVSFGGKALGIEFLYQASTNLSARAVNPDDPDPLIVAFPKGWLRISNTSVSAWYALNSAHYSHNAAIKQSYLQKRSAGSLLLSLSYLSTDMRLSDDFHYHHTYLIDDVKHIVTRQVALGLGYGINYTPNHGKVLLHAAAFAQLVCYSINQLSLERDSLRGETYGEPMYNIKPKHPVHVTGNVRAAVSWEINEWVHLTAWAQGNHVRFHSRPNQFAEIHMGNWNWQVHLDVGVRLGAGKKKVQESMADLLAEPLPPLRKSKLPKWIQEYFYSPSL